jgi:hypothetical protein
MRVFIAFVGLTNLTLSQAATAFADDAAAPQVIKQPFGYFHAGVGLIEVAHVQGGVFLSPRLTADAILAWAAVFGSRWGGGLTYAIGPATPGRPPRHALLLGARVMFDDRLTFDAHGDDASSYFVAPIGYGFLADNGFSLRIGAGPAVNRERTNDVNSQTGHRWLIGGPFFTMSGGFWF